MELESYLEHHQFSPTRKTKNFGVLAMFPFILVLMSSLVAAEIVDKCTDLNVSGTLYNLSRSLDVGGSCISISADNITLDCKNYEITFGDVSSDSYGIYSDADNVTIRNCLVQTTNSTRLNQKGIYIENAKSFNLSSNIIFLNTDYSHAVYLDNSNGAILNNNAISHAGASSYLVYLSNSSDTQILNGDLSNEGDYGLGIYSTHSNNVSIHDNEVNSEGSSGYAIFLMFGVGSSIYSNAITTSQSEAVGIGTESEEELNVYSNTIETVGVEAHPIYLLATLNSNFYENEIVSDGNSAVGILVGYNSEENNISSNTITSNALADPIGVYLSSAASNLVTSNNFSINTPNSINILSERSSTNSITNNQIPLLNNQSIGVKILESSGDLITQNSFSSIKRDSIAIYLDSSSEVQTINNEINFSGYNSSGIVISSSTGINNLSSDSIHVLGSSSNGFLLGSNNYLQDFRFESFQISDSSNALHFSDFTDITASFLNFSGSGYSLSADASASGSWKFTNTELSSVNWDSSRGILMNEKNISIYSKYSDDTIIDEVELSIIDSIGNVILNDSTSGGSLSVSLLEYLQNETGITYSALYTINASYGGTNISESINISDSNKFTLYFPVLETQSQHSSSGSSSSASNVVSEEKSKEKCIPHWECSEWTACKSGIQRKVCLDNNNCGERNAIKEKKCSGKSKKEVLFDINLKILDRAPKGQLIKASIGLINVALPGQVEAKLLYIIEDKSGKIVYSEEETVPVETQAEFIKEINISSLQNGQYDLNVFLSYGGQTEPASAQESFYVGGGIAGFIFKNFTILIIILLPLFLVLVLIPRVFRLKIMDWHKKAKARFMAHYDKILG